MASENNKALNFQLTKINTKDFQIIDSAFDLKSGADVGLNMGIDFAVNKEEKFVVSTVNVKFLQNEKAFIVISVEGEFMIDKISWGYLVKEEDNITLPQGLAAHFADIVVNTLRGVLHAKTEGSDFNKFLFPMVNVSQFITGDISVTD